MKCPSESRETELLMSYSVGELDAAAVPGLDSHLETCSACREFVRKQQALWNAMDAWQAPPVSTDFNRRLYQRIDQQASWLDRILRPIQNVSWRPLIPVAASAAVVLMAGLLLERTSMRPATPPVDTAQMEAIQPEQLELALDEMRTLSQLSRSDSADSPKM